MQIKNQIAIITGGASGMGAATAKHLQKLKANVIVLDKKESAQFTSLNCDISDSAAITQAFSHIQQTIGTPTICINCAGIAPAKKIIGKEGCMPLDDFSQVISINLTGTF